MVIAFFSGFFSSDIIAQSSLTRQEKSTQVLPKALYIEKYLATNPSLHLANNPLLPGKIEKVGTCELFNFYRLPLDQMICVAPTKEVKFHINVYDPTITIEYSSANIPNAFAKGELIK
jgi:hypothetical protein